MQKNVDYIKLKIIGDDKKEHDFSDYRIFKELFRDLYYRTITVDEAESKQDEFSTVLHLLKKYNPKHDKYVTLKNNLEDNVSKFYEGRVKIIEGFKNEVFPLYRDREHEEQIFHANKFNNSVNKQETSINKELFKNYFSFQTPSALLKELYKTNDKEKNRPLVNLINSGLNDLKEEIKKLSEKGKEIEDPESTVKIVKEILNFNEQNQKAKGIKILTPNQMLSTLPISLAQLKAANNSEKLKNDIRQLLHSLYRSKNMTKQV